MLRLLGLLLLSEFVRTGFIVSILPNSIDRLGLTSGFIGLMVGTHFLFDAIGKGTMGIAVHRWGLGRMLALGAALGLLTLLDSFFFSYPAIKIILCALWGLFLGVLWPGVMHATQIYAHPDRTSRVLAVSNLSVAPPILAGVLFIGPLMLKQPDLAWNIVLIAQGLALLFGLSLLALRLPKPPQTVPIFAPEARKDWLQVATLLPAAFVQTLAPGLLFTLLFPMLTHLKLSLSDLVLPGMIAGVSCGLGVWLFGRIADRIEPRRALLPGLLFLAITFAFCAATTPNNVDVRLWILAPLLGLGYGAFFAGWNGLVAKTMPKDHQTTAWGAVMAVESMGYVVGPILGGLLWQWAGLPAVFLMGAAVFLLAQGYYLLLGLQKKNPDPSEISSEL